jgi:hypothetical protein
MQPASPSPAELRELVEAAIRFRDAEPWSHVTDDQVFGLLDPEQDELGYVCIAGHSGLEQGLNVFPGPEGHRTLLRMQHEWLPEDTDDMLLVVRNILCTFMQPADLLDIDRQLLRTAGVAPRSGASWPQFISHEPGYASWTVNGAEARLLRAAFEQSLIVARRLERDPDLLERGMPGEYLVRAIDDEGAPGSWTDCWMRPPRTRDLRAPDLDDVTAGRLARLPLAENREWEVDAVTGIGRLAESAAVRPRVLRTLTVVERGSGYMHGAEVFEAPDFAAQVAGLFIRLVLSIGHRPRRILVRDYHLRNLLARAAKAMDCRLQRVLYLPLIERAQALLRERRAAAVHR